MSTRPERGSKHLEYPLPTYREVLEIVSSTNLLPPDLSEANPHFQLTEILNAAKDRSLDLLRCGCFVRLHDIKQTNEPAKKIWRPGISGRANLPENNDPYLFYVVSDEPQRASGYEITIVSTTTQAEARMSDQTKFFTFDVDLSQARFDKKSGALILRGMQPLVSGHERFIVAGDKFKGHSPELHRGQHLVCSGRNVGVNTKYFHQPFDRNQLQGIVQSIHVALEDDSSAFMALQWLRPTTNGLDTFLNVRAGKETGIDSENPTIALEGQYVLDQYGTAVASVPPRWVDRRVFSEVSEVIDLHGLPQRLGVPEIRELTKDLGAGKPWREFLGRIRG